MGEKTTKGEFTLPNKRVVVKFIKRKRGMAAGDHITEDHVISGGMLTNSTRKFQAPLLRNGSIANVLSTEEKEYLEGETDLNLSSYGSFWKEQFVTLRKEDNSFDLSNPIDYISVKILESCKALIAPDWDSRSKKLTYQFVITEPGAEMKEVKKKYDAKKEAFKLYGKIEEDKPQLLGILKILEKKPISANSDLDWIQGKVEGIIDETPKKFVDLIKNPAYHTMLLLNKGLEAGVIQRQGNKYATTDGLDLADVGQIPTFDVAIRYLDDPKNQEVRTLIEAKITNAD
jgi:hypothetical protein